MSPANRYVCPNWTGPVYATAGVTGSLSNPLRVTDNLRTTNSWFYCQTRFPGRNNPAYGVGKNDYWLLTVGDDSGRTGWFAANRVKIGDNWQPIPGVPGCRF